MELSDKDKFQILQSFIGIFFRICNKKYQKRVWIKGEGPEVDGFDDTVNEFFGECDSILKDYKDFKITDQQHVLLVKFRDEFKKFSRRHDLPIDFLDVAEWTKITEMAKEVLQAFNYKRP